MTRVLGEFAVAFDADTRGVGRGMGDARRHVRLFDQDFKRMAGGIVAAGKQAALAITAIGAAGILMAQNAARASIEIENLSRVAGASPEQFQRMAFASRTVGIEQEKLSDILKDVQDKVGDFLETGGGPLADFFEKIAPKVGVTADEFARLSGPEALQLYVDSLERANVSQNEMTFYLEAIASDAALMLPILRDSGRALQELGDQAERSGAIVSNDLIRQGAELDREFKLVAATIRGSLNAAILENSDEVIGIAEDIREVWIPALVEVAGFITSVVSLISDLSSGIGSAIQKLHEFKAASRETAGDMVNAREDALTRRGIGRVDGNGFEVFDPRGDDVYSGLVNPWAPTRRDPEPFDLGEIVVHGPSQWAPRSSTRPRLPGVDASFGSADPNSGGGGGGGSPDREDFERLRDQLATQQEQIDLAHTEQLEKLREFREAKILTEEEFNETEMALQQQHAEALAALDRKSRQERLRALGGAFGDLSSLMRTESGKLFKIGKAAALAEAIVSGHGAAVAAWEKGMKVGGPPMAAAFTAASLARTGAMIASIQSQQIGGGGGGGGGAGGGAGGAGLPVEPLEARIVGLTSDQFFTGDSIEALLTSLQDRAEDRGLRFTFAQ